MLWDVIVLKFGSSVLRGPPDLSGVADEVYRHLREGKRVLAVVSAFAGQTDRLLKDAQSALGDSAPQATAAYVATGEMQAAAMLTGALLRAGVASRCVDPREARLRITGDLLNAQLEGIDARNLHHWFEEFSVLVLPGFFGIDAAGHIGLLGRGGSDYTALYLAHQLGAECRLVKDVPGIYDKDPAIAGSRARRLDTIDWDAAIPIAGKLVQPKAIQFAQSKRFSFSVGALASSEHTLVGDYPTTFASPRTSEPRLKIALMGLGTVGGGVYARLSAQPQRFEVVCVLVKNLAKHAGVAPVHVMTDDPRFVLSSGANLVIDALSGTSTSREIALAALQAGVPVVSANKAFVALHWHELSQYTLGDSPDLLFNAAVGGALPLLENLRLHAGYVRSVRGIINGTCNYILDALRAGTPYPAALQAAQAAGFAEANPTADISGADAANKLRLIAAAGFGAALPADSISVEGIDAKERKSNSYLVAKIDGTAGTLVAEVGLEALQTDDFLAGARGEENRVEITLENGRVLRFAGRGAGRWPTTISVMGDVLQAWRAHAGIRFPQFPQQEAALAPVADCVPN
jgi:homoserine dehydrogenase